MYWVNKLVLENFSIHLSIFSSFSSRSLEAAFPFSLSLQIPSGAVLRISSCVSGILVKKYERNWLKYITNYKITNTL